MHFDWTSLIVYLTIKCKSGWHLYSDVYNYLQVSIGKINMGCERFSGFSLYGIGPIHGISYPRATTIFNNFFMPTYVDFYYLSDEAYFNLGGYVNKQLSHSGHRKPASIH